MASRIRGEEGYHTLNQSKRNMQQETRFTEIERENRMLLEKITTIMKKKESKNESNCNRSLNHFYRQRQYESIEQENAKMLKRLQSKRSEYDVGMMNKKWRQTRSMLKHLTLHTIDPKDMQHQITRQRLISGISFLVTVKLHNEELIILADNKSEKEIKAIQLSAPQTRRFLRNQCKNDLEKVLECLRYNPQEGTLLLVARASRSKTKANPRTNRHLLNVKPPSLISCNRIDPAQIHF